MHEKGSNAMEDDWSKNSQYENNAKEHKPDLKVDLYFPEKLSSEVLESYLVKRNIAKKDQVQTKENLVDLFRKHITPLPQRKYPSDSKTKSYDQIKQGVKTISLEKRKDSSRFVSITFVKRNIEIDSV